MTMVTSITKSELEKAIGSHQQSHLLAFWNELTDTQQTNLQQQIAQLDLELISQLTKNDDGSHDWAEVGKRAKAPKAIRLNQSEPTDQSGQDDAIVLSQQALANGEVGCILVAGGQGTRLGFLHPKGMYKIGPVSDRTLFQMHIDQIKAIAKKYQTSIPLFLMTSPATDAETRSFLREHDFFGLSEKDVTIFCQGTMPAIDAKTGKILLESKDRLFASPDGHGGMLVAFCREGCMDSVQERGIKHLFYFQIDNPLVSICDLETIGHHIRSKSELSTQVVAKNDAADKVGNVVDVDGQTMVIEYSDLDSDSAARRDENGNLELWAGNVAVHVFSVDFLARASKDADSLPFHRAVKKVPYIDSDGNQVEPTEPNAIKFERFIFDLLPKANNTIVVEVDAERSFAPLKNASGSPKDTPETTRAAIVRESRRMLTAAGATVDDGVDVEVSPLFALDVDELKSKLDLDTKITSPTFFED